MTIEYGDSRLPDRFWDKVHPVPEMSHWVWSAARKCTGHNPTFTIKGKVTTVLRVYFLTFFPEYDPEKYRPQMDCGVSDCVNPNHVVVAEKGTCLKGHKAPKVGGGGCAECKHIWYVNHRKGSGQRRPSKNERAGIKPGTTAKVVNTKPELSVFGDKKPDKPWRPEGWSEFPNLGVSQKQWSHQSNESDSRQRHELEHSG